MSPKKVLLFLFLSSISLIAIRPSFARPIHLHDQNNQIYIAPQTLEIRWNTLSINEASLTVDKQKHCLLYTSPSPRDRYGSRMPSSA